MEQETNVEVRAHDILKVSYEEDGRYAVVINEGMSVAEVAFAITVIAKIFDRDGVIPKHEFMEMINNYMENPQYEEMLS